MIQIDASLSYPPTAVAIEASPSAIEAAQPGSPLAAPANHNHHAEKTPPPPPQGSQGGGGRGGNDPVLTARLAALEAENNQLRLRLGRSEASAAPGAAEAGAKAEEQVRSSGVFVDAETSTEAAEVSAEVARQRERADCAETLAAAFKVGHRGAVGF